MTFGTKLPWTLMKNLKLLKRNVGQNQFACENKKGMMYILKKSAFEWSGFNRYGLYSHDVIDYSHPVISEALRRLPKDVLDARNFRIIRALQLHLLRIHLPREKWITYEQDLEYRYLGPYVEEINAEQEEIFEFGCLNYKDDDWPAGEIK